MLRRIKRTQLLHTKIEKLDFNNFQDDFKKQNSTGLNFHPKEVAKSSVYGAASTNILDGSEFAGQSKVIYSVEFGFLKSFYDAD